MGDTGTDIRLMEYLQTKYADDPLTTVLCVGVKPPEQEGEKEYDFTNSADIVVSGIDAATSLVNSMSKFDLSPGSRELPQLAEMAEDATLEFYQGTAMTDALRAWQYVAGVDHLVVPTTVGIDKAEQLVTDNPVSYTHLRAHETREDLVCRLLLEKKKK